MHKLRLGLFLSSVFFVVQCVRPGLLRLGCRVFGVQGVLGGHVLGLWEKYLHELRCWLIPKWSWCCELSKLPVRDLFEFSWSDHVNLVRELLCRDVLYGWVRLVHSLLGRYLRFISKSFELHGMRHGNLHSSSRGRCLFHLCG